MLVMKDDHVGLCHNISEANILSSETFSCLQWQDTYKFTTKELGFIISSPVILNTLHRISYLLICFAFCSHKILLVNALAHLQKRKPHDIQPTKFDIYLKMQTCLNIQIH